MATIETNSDDRNKSKLYLNKKSTRVDLTPMVDLGFLLITFFVFTTTMTKPTAMKVFMPYDEGATATEICNSCALTVLLCKDNLIRYYEGGFDSGKIQTASYTTIRDIIQEKKRKVELTRGNANQFVLIIKSTSLSSFGNFVDITDEVTINNVKRYFIDEPTNEEIVIASL